MAEPDPGVLRAALELADDALASVSRRPVVIGICGAQGCGKTTLTRAMVGALEGRGLLVASLSLDDLYLTRADRKTLAREVHPLLATRGVPGTHDVALGCAVFDALDAGERVSLPRFDKARDDRSSREEWTIVEPGLDVLLFEGWCVGAVAQPDEALAEPVNQLESREDPEGVWRRYANRALGDHYRSLFTRIDSLLMLAAPGFETVFDWRLQQEEELRRNSVLDADRIMDSAQVERFVRHYERLTRHILAEMPSRADVVVRLDEARRALRVERSG